MDDVQMGQSDLPEVERSARHVARDQTPTRNSRTLGLGAVAFGAFAVGATAIGALAIGRLAVGTFAMKRGRIRTLTVDNLEVRRLHVGKLIIDSGARVDVEDRGGWPRVEERKR
jgi:hypothetical protein